tara:strand:- start:226 stop:657 length:432 start_codon:yes stop_codon:yes gene_type:complete
MFKELWESIKKNEGYEPKVYKDHLGFDTIGVGFKVSELHLDEDVCDIIGVRKLNDIQAQLIATFPWYPEMPQVIRMIMIECSYQMGVKGWSKFKKANKYLSERNWVKASEEMLDSKWAKEQTPKRARLLAETVKQYKSNKGEK